MLPSHTLLGERLWRQVRCTSSSRHFSARAAQRSSLLLHRATAPIVNVRRRFTALHSLIVAVLLCPVLTQRDRQTLPAK
jgi:hypothetical protein